jgi:hypothetical protein
MTTQSQIVESLTWCQFHQHFSRAFFVQIFGANLCFSLVSKIHTKNARLKCWWNWRLDYVLENHDFKSKSFTISNDLRNSLSHDRCSTNRSKKDDEIFSSWKYPKHHLRQGSQTHDPLNISAYLADYYQNSTKFH